MLNIDPGHLMGVAAIIAAVGGLWATAHSRRDTNRQQAAANELQRQEAQRVKEAQDHDYFRAMVEDQRLQIDKMRERHDQDMDRCRAELDAERDRSARFHREYLEMRSLVVGQVTAVASLDAGEAVDLPPMNDDEEMGT